MEERFFITDCTAQDYGEAERMMLCSQEEHGAKEPELFAQTEMFIWPDRYFTETELERLTENGGHICLKAVDGETGEMAGFAYGQTIGSVHNDDAVYQSDLYLRELYVKREYRRQGAGTALLSCMKERAKEAGADCIRLHIHGTNDAGTDFFRASGMEECGLDMKTDIGKRDSAGAQAEAGRIARHLFEHQWLPMYFCVSAEHLLGILEEDGTTIISGLARMAYGKVELASPYTERDFAVEAKETGLVKDGQPVAFIHIRMPHPAWDGECSDIYLVFTEDFERWFDHGRWFYFFVEHRVASEENFLGGWNSGLCRHYDFGRCPEEGTALEDRILDIFMLDDLGELATAETCIQKILGMEEDKEEDLRMAVRILFGEKKWKYETGGDGRLFMGVLNREGCVMETAEMRFICVGQHLAVDFILKPKASRDVIDEVNRLFARINQTQRKMVFLCDQDSGEISIQSEEAYEGIDIAIMVMRAENQFDCVEDQLAAYEAAVAKALSGEASAKEAFDEAERLLEEAVPD